MQRINIYTHPGGVLTDSECAQLQDAAYSIRVLATKVISMCNWGHPGGSYSLAEMLAVLLGGASNLTPQNCTEKDRDLIVLSKAHTSPALYAALHVFGFLDEATLFSYGTVGGLEGHLAKDNPPGVDCTGGSLGLGLSYCAGLANALKLKENYKQRVYCICGDGELNEGQMWEAMMFAAQNRLDNLVLLIDNNKVMAKSFTHAGMNIEPLSQKLQAFGLTVEECDGHDVNGISQSLYRARYTSEAGKPHAIICHTTKGRGVDECEFNYRWHTHAPDIQTANRFLRTLAAAYEKPCEPIERTFKGPDPGLKGLLEESL